MFGLIEEALDLAVEGGFDWEKRQSIDSLLAKRLSGVETAPSEVNIQDLLAQWEGEVGRLGSAYAGKQASGYQRLLELDQADVLRAALKRLTKASSPYLLTLLSDIAGAAPAANETTVSSASMAWLEWGKRQGFIS